MNVILNERDMTTFTELYGSCPTLMLSACFIDTAHIALVVVPILYGEGMMTKVAEAMMYGKNILATSHALNGYHEIEESCRCDTPEEYISRINAMIENGTERFNPEMRKIFEEQYSINAMVNTIRESLKQHGIL